MTMDLIVEFDTEEHRDAAIEEHEAVELWKHQRFPMAHIGGVKSFSTTLLEEKKFYLDDDEHTVVRLENVVDVVQADT